MIGVKDYFDKKSSSYQSDSHKGMWGLIKRKELLEFSLALPEREVKKILEVGSGVGVYTRVLKEKYPHSQITCVDISPQMNRQNKVEGCKKLVGDISTFRMEEKFDLICAAGSLEFVDNLDLVFKNLKQMLSGHGEIVLLVPKSDLPGFLYKIFHASHGIWVKLFSRRKIINLVNRNSLVLLSQKNVWPLARIIKIKSKYNE